MKDRFNNRSKIRCFTNQWNINKSINPTMNVKNNGRIKFAGKSWDCFVYLGVRMHWNILFMWCWRDNSSVHFLSIISFMNFILQQNGERSPVSQSVAWLTTITDILANTDACSTTAVAACSTRVSTICKLPLLRLCSFWLIVALVVMILLVSPTDSKIKSGLAIGISVQPAFCWRPLFHTRGKLRVLGQVSAGNPSKILK